MTGEPFKFHSKFF